jgi:hypothetical protein
MRPVCWSQPGGENTAVASGQSEEKIVQAPPESAPAESPGMFVAQPLERWSPRDLVVGVARLVRSTSAAIVRGVATS